MPAPSVSGPLRLSHPYWGSCALAPPVDAMAPPVARFATRIAYGATQLPRVAWHMRHAVVMRRVAVSRVHGVLMRRLSAAVRERSGQSPRRPARTDASVPGRNRLYADMATLFRQDLANVEAGIYPLPADHDGSWPALLHRSRLFFEDLPDVHR